MTKIVETIYNCETGEVTEILSTPEYEAKMAEEIKKQQKFQAEIEKQEAIIAANKQAVLKKLGITEEQARLLLS